ncbi:glycerol-3-phosphate responsive antiterminator [Bacillus sp. AK128]
MKVRELLSTQGMIAAAKPEDFKEALDSNARFVTLMNSKLSFFLDNQSFFSKITKPFFIHTDLMKGLSNDKEAFQFLVKNVKPTGIVTTKSNMIRSAKKEGLQTIMRIFLIDTSSLDTAIQNIKENQPDAVEIMPGIAPQIVPFIQHEVQKPIIVGGLISTKEQIQAAFQCGADGVSLSKKDFWNARY